MVQKGIGNINTLFSLFHQDKERDSRSRPTLMASEFCLISADTPKIALSRRSILPNSSHQACLPTTRSYFFSQQFGELTESN
jgi:hypothetical protein